MTSATSSRRCCPCCSTPKVTPSSVAARRRRWVASAVAAERWPAAGQQRKKKRGGATVAVGACLRLIGPHRCSLTSAGPSSRRCVVSPAAGRRGIPGSVGGVPRGARRAPFSGRLCLGARETKRHSLVCGPPFAAAEPLSAERVSRVQLGWRGSGTSSNASTWAGRTTRKSRWFSVAMVVSPRRSATVTIEASTRPRPMSA